MLNFVVLGVLKSRCQKYNPMDINKYTICQKVNQLLSFPGRKSSKIEEWMFLEDFCTATHSRLHWLDDRCEIS